MAEVKNSSNAISDWWLPGHEDEDTTPGTYTVEDNGKASAVFHRILGSDSIFGLEDYEIVHGVTFGKAVTLVDSKVKKARAGFSGQQAEIQILPRIAIEGLLLSSEELKLTEAKVRIQRQDEWIGPRLFAAQREPGDRFIRGVSYQPFPDIHAEIPGGTVSVCDFSSYREEGFDVIVTSKTGFHFKFAEPVDLKSFIMEHLRGLQLLVTLASGKQCGLESLRFTNSGWEIEGSRHESERWVTARMQAPEMRTTRGKRDHLFHFSAMNWTTQAPLVFDLSVSWKYTIEQWALLLDDRFAWPVARFAAAASAVESLDRILNPDEKYEPDGELKERVLAALSQTELSGKDRKKVKGALSRPKEISLAARIQRLSTLAPDAMKDVIDQPLWGDRVARLRHVVSHGLQSSEDLGKDVRPLQCATEVLLHLLESIFLLHLGFNGETLSRMRRDHPNTVWRKSVVDECFDLLPPAENGPALTEGNTSAK